MNYALSDEDIAKYIPNVVKYGDLRNMTSEQLLAMMPVVILYETRPGEGHWVLLHRLGNGNVEFFDSYGFAPDKEFGLINRDMQQPHYVARLLYDLSLKIPIHYNEYRLQGNSPGLATCGRWCIMREMFGEADIDTFKRALDIVTRALGISGDEFVSRLIKV